MDKEFDFSILPDAGVTQLEFAALVGVSRVTVNLWAAGKMRPHQYIRARVKTLMTAFQKAVQHDLLPLPKDTPKDRKMELVKAALRDAVHRSTAALHTDAEIPA